MCAPTALQKYEPSNEPSYLPALRMSCHQASYAHAAYELGTSRITSCSHTYSYERPLRNSARNSLTSGSYPPYAARTLCVVPNVRGSYPRSGY